MLVLIAVLALEWYISTNKEEIIAKVQELANESLEGNVQFDTIELSSIKKFPDIAVTIEDLLLTDSLYHEHKIPTLKLHELSASISVLDLWNEEIQINSVDVEGGNINMFVMKDHYTNNYVFQPVKKTNTNKKKSKLKIEDNYIDVNLENLQFWFREKVKNKRIQAKINDIEFEIDPSRDEHMIPEIELDVVMTELGLNLANGSFFNGAHVLADIPVVINKSEKTFHTPEFEMEVDDQELINTIWVKYDEGKFKFNIKMAEANYQETIGLLSQNISKKLGVFNFSNSLKAEAEIDGKFEYKNNPVVTVWFETEDNQFDFQSGKIHLDEVNTKGYFKNRVFDDARAEHESVKNFKLYIDDFQAEFKNIPFEIYKSTFVGQKLKTINFDVHLTSDSDARDWSKLIDSDAFEMTEGKVHLESNIKGPVKELANIFAHSKSSFKIEDLGVKLKKEKIDIEIEDFWIEVEEQKSKLKNLVAHIDDEEKVIVNGDVSNIGGFFSKRYKKPITKVNVYSPYLSIEKLAKKFGKKNTIVPSAPDLSTIKSSFRTILGSFNPDLTIKIDKLNIKGTEIKDLHSNAYYNQGILHLTDLSGKGEYGSGKGQVKLDLNPLQKNNEEELKFNIEVDLNSRVDRINDFLKNDNFFFYDAPITLKTSYNGVAADYLDVLKKAELQLDIGKGKVVNKSLNQVYYYDTLSINLQKNNAKLNTFVLDLPKNEKLKLSGSITNFTHLIDDNASYNEIRSNIKLSSNKLHLSNLNTAFSNGTQSSTSSNNTSTSSGGNSIKTTFIELNNRFHPKLEVDFNEFYIGTQALNDFSAKVNLSQAGELDLDDFSFLYEGQPIDLKAKLDISKNNITPLQADFEMDKIDISSLLKTFDYFKFNKLRPPTNLSGNLTSDLKLKAIIEDGKGLKDGSLAAEGKLLLNDFRLKNFEPIITIGDKIFKKERFEDIQFNDIEADFIIKNKKLYLSQTAIQSTAFDVFIEGVIDNGNQTFVWVSIPLENLKKRDYHELPELKNIDDIGGKIYLEIQSDANGKLIDKIRLSKRSYEHHEQDLKTSSPF